MKHERVLGAPPSRAQRVVGAPQVSALYTSLSVPGLRAVVEVLGCMGGAGGLPVPSQHLQTLTFYVCQALPDPWLLGCLNLLCWGFLAPHFPSHS